MSSSWSLRRSSKVSTRAWTGKPKRGLTYRGRRLCFLRITFYQKGEVCAYGTQTVAVTPDSPQMTHYFSADGSQLLPGTPPKTKAKL